MPYDKVEWDSAPPSAIAWTCDVYGHAQWICVSMDGVGRWHHHSMIASGFGCPAHGYADSLTVRPQATDYNYDVDDFLAKFEAIPEEKWCCLTHRNVDGRMDALGLCGFRDHGYRTPEGVSLIHLFDRHGLTVYSVNDGRNPDFHQPTPKQRILAALRDIKAGKNG